jgi:chemotaxis-related protein WspB
MSTRIVLVNYAEPGGKTYLLGLLAEQTTETIRREAADFVDAGVAVDSAPYLGPVTTDAQGIIQRIEINQLLPAHVRELLFRQPIETA